MWLALSLALILAATDAAAQEYPLVGQDGVVTLVNLHPDEGRARLYSVNYQLDGLIPLCTRVRILEETGKGIVFRVEDTGKEYTYLKHKSLVAPFHQHLDQLFGTKCPDLAGLSPADRQGVESGRVALGMTKRGVLLALGPPPDHKTASTDLDQWRYWRNRFKTFLVHFSDGKVTRIQN